MYDDDFSDSGDYYDTDDLQLKSDNDAIEDGWADMREDAESLQDDCDENCDEDCDGDHPLRGLQEYEEDIRAAELHLDAHLEAQFETGE